jgi:hypothetical protein
MPRAPITPSIVAGPVGRGTYSAQDVAQVQPQQPGMLVQQGQQLQRLGGALEDVAEVQRIKQVEALATEQDTKLAESFRNSNSEFGKLEGRAAVDSFKDYEKGIRDSAKKMLEGVTDPLAQRVIRESADRRVQQSLNWATQHRDRQQETWLKGSVETAMQGAIEDYKQAVAAGDPDADRFARTAMLYRQKRNAMDGKDENQNRISELALTTTLHGGAVDGMIEREEFGKAAAYLQKHKGEIAVDFFDQRNRVVTGGVKRDTAYSLATTVLQSANGDPFKAQESLQQLFNAKEIDSNMLDMAEDRVMRMSKMEANQREVENAQVVTNAEQWLAAPENRGRPLSDNPEMYEAVAKAGKLPQLLSFQEKGRYTNSPEVLSMLGSMSEQDLASISPEAFHGMVHGNLTPSQEAFWKAKHRAANGRASKADRTIISMDQRVNRAAREAGIIATPDKTQWEEGQAARYEDFEFAINDQLKAWQDKNHREPSDAEIQSEIIDPTVKNTVILNGERRTFAGLTSDEQGESMVVVPGRPKPIYLRDIPTSRIREMSSDFELAVRAGIIPRSMKLNWQMIGTEYARMLADGRATEGEASPSQDYSQLPSQLRLMPTPFSRKSKPMQLGEWLFDDPLKGK